MSSDDDSCRAEELLEARLTRADLAAAEGRGSDDFVLKDRFGFFLTDQFHKELSLAPAELDRRRRKEEERAKKWEAMFRKWKKFDKNEATALLPPLSPTHVTTSVPVPVPSTIHSTSLTVVEDRSAAAVEAEPSSLSLPLSLLADPRLSRGLLVIDNSHNAEKLKERVRKGIPEVVRAEAWKRLLRVDLLRSSLLSEQSLQSLDTSSLDEKTREEIERDIDRTFPRHELFVEAQGAGQRSLRNLLQWYAVLDPEVGYCQGMGFIAGLFLTYMSEEDAFYMFYAALQRSSAPLRLLYLPRLTETKKVLFVFEKLCEMHLPQLWAHLTGEGMHPTMFFTEWMMCIFCRGFSFELVTRVWDIFLHEGNIKIVYRVSLAILKVYDIALHAF
jgi:hypothetical protein